MKNIGSALLMIGIILVMLSTAFLAHYEKPKRSVIDTYNWGEAQRILRRGRGDTGMPTKTIVTYALLGAGCVLTMVGLLVTVRQRPDKKRFFAVPLEYFGRTMIGFTIARIVASALLIWALSEHPYDYYTLLRFVVCGATAYGTYLAVRFRKIAWAWIFGVVAVLFNPIFPIHLERSTWAIIDVVIAVLLTLSIFLFKEPRVEK